MTTSAFDSYRPPDEGGRRRRRDTVRTSVSDAARNVARSGGGWLTGDGGGRREAPAVPEAQFSSYYGRSVVKPMPWRHEIPAYLFLGGVAAGSGLLASGAAATGLDVLRRRSRLTAMATVALSGAVLVKDLGRPERFLNMLRTVKLTSPMSVGTWIFSGYSAFTGVTQWPSWPMMPRAAAGASVRSCGSCVPSKPRLPSGRRCSRPLWPPTPRCCCRTRPPPCGTRAAGSCRSSSSARLRWPRGASR